MRGVLLALALGDDSVGGAEAAELADRALPLTTGETRSIPARRWQRPSPAGRRRGSGVAGLPRLPLRGGLCPAAACVRRCFRPAIARVRRRRASGGFVRRDLRFFSDPHSPGSADPRPAVAGDDHLLARGDPVDPLTELVAKRVDADGRWIRRRQTNGAEGARTPDLVTASHALSQLSYSPVELGLISKVNTSPVVGASRAGGSAHAGRRSAMPARRGRTIVPVTPRVRPVRRRRGDSSAVVAAVLRHRSQHAARPGARPLRRSRPRRWCLCGFRRARTYVPWRPDGPPGPSRQAQAGSRSASTAAGRSPTGATAGPGVTRPSA